MSGFKIKLVNVRVKDGKVIPQQSYSSVSQKIAKRASKKVTVARGKRGTK